MPTATRATKAPAQRQSGTGKRVRTKSAVRNAAAATQIVSKT